MVGELLAESYMVFVSHYDDKGQYIGADEALVFVGAPYLTDSDLFRESEFDAAFARIQALIE